MLILTRPVVKTGHYWSIGDQLKWLIGLIKSLAYKIVYHMPLSFRHDCLCCSVATARVLSNLLKQVHLCEHNHRNSAAVHIYLAIFKSGILGHVQK